MVAASLASHVRGHCTRLGMKNDIEEPHQVAVHSFCYILAKFTQFMGYASGLGAMVPSAEPKSPEIQEIDGMIVRDTSSATIGCR